MCVSTVHVACSKLTRETYFMWQQCFLDSVGVCETISYVRELCIISNILSVLVPHLFYFTLFLDPLFVCMYIYVCTTFCLPLSSNPFLFLFTPSIFLPLLFFNFSFIQCFPFLPPLFFHSFIHFIPFSFTFHICPFPFHGCFSLTAVHHSLSKLWYPPSVSNGNSNRISAPL